MGSRFHPTTIRPPRPPGSDQLRPVCSALISWVTPQQPACWEVKGQTSCSSTAGARKVFKMDPVHVTSRPQLSRVNTVEEPWCPGPPHIPGSPTLGQISIHTTVPTRAHMDRAMSRGTQQDAFTPQPTELLSLWTITAGSLQCSWVPCHSTTALHVRSATPGVT